MSSLLLPPLSPSVSVPPFPKSLNPRTWRMAGSVASADAPRSALLVGTVRMPMSLKPLSLVRRLSTALVSASDCSLLPVNTLPTAYSPKAGRSTLNVSLAACRDAQARGGGREYTARGQNKLKPILETRILWASAWGRDGPCA